MTDHIIGSGDMVALVGRSYSAAMKRLRKYAAEAIIIGNRIITQTPTGAGRRAAYPLFRVGARYS